MNSIDHHGFYDFGNLPETLQEKIIEKLIDPCHQTTPQLLINDRTQPLKSWIEDALTQNHQEPQHLQAFSIATHCEQTCAIYTLIMNQNPSPASALDPNDILERYLIAEEFHFLKSPPDPKID